MSGCTVQPKANGTWGEKKPPTPNDFKIFNESTVYNEAGYFYITGYIYNNYGEAASNVKIIGTGYDENGIVIASNSQYYMDPEIIPVNGNSYFEIYLEDPEKKIVRYELKIEL